MTLTNLSCGHPLGNNDVKAWGNPGVAGRISDGWMLLGSSHTFSGGPKLYYLGMIGSSYGGVWPCFCCKVRNWTSKPPVTWDPMILRVQLVDTLVETLVRIWKTWGWRREHVIYRNTKSPRFWSLKSEPDTIKGPRNCWFMWNHCVCWGTKCWDTPFFFQRPRVKVMPSHSANVFPRKNRFQSGWKHRVFANQWSSLPLLGTKIPFPKHLCSTVFFFLRWDICYTSLEGSSLCHRPQTKWDLHPRKTYWNL